MTGHQDISDEQIRTAMAELTRPLAEETALEETLSFRLYTHHGAQAH